MKIILRRGPNVLGVTMGADLDTEELPQSEADELHRLVGQAHIAESNREPAGLVPDQRQITIRVEEGERQLQATFPEGLSPTAIEPLLEYLDRYTKVIPVD